MTFPHRNRNCRRSRDFGALRSAPVSLFLLNDRVVSLLIMVVCKKGGFKKAGFGGYSWTSKTGTRVQKPVSLDPQNRNEGTKKGMMVPKPGTKVYSPRPPFYRTALLIPLDHMESKEAPTLSTQNVESKARSFTRRLPWFNP